MAAASKIERWLEHDRRRKIRAKHRHEIFSYIFTGVRRIFILLLVAAICVFIHNHRVEIETLTLAKLHEVAAKPASSLGQHALDYEKHVNEIAK